MIENIKYRISIIKKLLPFTYKVKKYFVILILTNITNMVLILIGPLLFKILVDEVIINKNLSALIVVVIGYCSIYIVGLLIDVLSNYSSNRLLNPVLFRMRMKIWENYLNMPFESYDKYSTGDLKIRLDEDLEKVSVFAQEQTSKWFISLITIIFTGIALCRITWQLALFSILIIPITFYLGNAVGRVERKYIEKRRECYSERDSWLQNSFSGWKEVKALNLQKHEYKTFVKFIHKLALINIKWINFWVLQVLVIPMIKDDFLMKFSLYFIGGIMIMRGNFTIGVLIVFMSYYNIFYQNINQMNDSNVELQRNTPSYERLFEVLTLEKKKDKKRIGSSSFSGNIVFDNVSFVYNSESKDVLKNINFEIKRGEIVAIVGKSGTGKSTLIKLLLGLIPCQRGKIMLGDTDISTLDFRVLHRKIGVVMQDSVFFNISIKDNLKLAQAKASIQDIKKACEMANIRGFIESLPQKYNTIIGERGVKLSGGQRQRLAVARVFLKNPDIVIFDEATSALDQQSQRCIYNSLQCLYEDRIVIIISHRLSSVVISDRVIVLQDGKLKGMAHHKELYGNNNAYDILFREQYIT